MAVAMTREIPEREKKTATRLQMHLGRKTCVREENWDGRTDELREEMG